MSGQLSEGSELSISSKLSKSGGTLQGLEYSPRVVVRSESGGTLRGWGYAPRVYGRSAFCGEDGFEAIQVAFGLAAGGEYLDPENTL